MITAAQTAKMNDAIRAEMRGSIGSSLSITATAQTRREVVMSGETPEQAKARWSREREIEQDRDWDARLSGGRVLPIHYE